MDIVGALRRKGALDADGLARLLRARNRERARAADSADRAPAPLAKRDVLAAYRAIERDDPGHWRRLGVTARDEAALFAAVRMKPRRTASGVATVSVVAKPWPCSGSCVYCPNDVRMPKSYLADEPACQRAERAFFDPYLQTASRLRALSLMGHPTGKVELIVLGGSWDDYPEGYRTWFARELFRALNDAEDPQTLEQGCARRRAAYERAGVPSDPDACAAFAAAAQADVDAGRATYADAWRRLYGDGAWERVARWQCAQIAEVEAEHARNERAAHRAVGLSFETRPDLVTAEGLRRMRRLGATKVQMGVQSLDGEVLRENGRGRADVAAVRRAFALLRAFGFKIHVHAMANLPGSTPERDIADFRRLMEDRDFLPDEAKVYPCVLVVGTGLSRLYERGDWRPYGEDELAAVLAADIAAAPPFARISRVVRDIPAPDIVAGNMRANLRQVVERRLAEAGTAVQEIRAREIGAAAVDVGSLSLDEVRYETSIGREAFLQWIGPDGRIAGFLRLSLPDAAQVFLRTGGASVRPGEAMIREVHVYGVAAVIDEPGGSDAAVPHAQHRGLGRALIERACAITREEGYAAVNVISAVGTRAYYRGLGFVDAGLYQRRNLA